jgi:hypothetical protein
MKFDRDRMMLANHTRVAAGAIGVIDRLQTRYEPEYQVLAAAAVLVLLAEHFGVRPLDVFDAISNMRRNLEGKTEFQAVQMYIEREIPR